MKRTFALFFIILGCLSIFSCKKGDNEPQSFSATIKKTTSYSTSTVTESSLSGIYDFTSTGSNNITMSLYLTDITVGSYPFTISNPGMGCIFDGNNYGNTVYTPRNTVPPGSIIITVNNNSTISGTFSGTLYNLNNIKDSIIISNGQFANLIY